MGVPAPWTEQDKSGVYRELEHPADLWLEIRGDDPAGLCENGLYALYASMVGAEGVRPSEERTLVAEGADLGEALRGLLAEALYRFDTEGFVGAAAAVQVEWETSSETEPSRVAACARVWGEILDPGRHEPLAEIKAVTYHLLAAAPDPGGGWRATVLFDL
ncbi:MAG: archease [Thermoleophilia bacterium]